MLGGIGMKALYALAITVLTLFGGVTGTCRADVVSYTFEAPNFAFGQPTPIINAPPNVGNPAFLTTFRDVADPGGATITNTTSFQPNNLMMGQFLFEPNSTGPLTLTFNRPVLSLMVNFAIDVSNFAPPGAISIVTPAGSATQNGANVGGTFQGGTLSFAGTSAFTTASLQGLSPIGGPTQIAIDNLNLTFRTQVPEIDASMLGGAFTLLTGGVLVLRSRRRQS
jgi:hypothetical protein